MGNFLSNSFMEIASKLVFTHTSYEEFDGALPADLMVEILQRLHSKPLMRFLSVSKAWHSVILSPAFTEKRQIYHQDKFITFLHPYKNMGNGVCLISEKTDDGDAIETFTDVPLPIVVETTIVGVLPTCFSNVYFLGCSNCFVCIRLCETTFLSTERTRFGLWNPATRQFKLLSSPKNLMYRPPDDHELFGSIDGFSYVPRIKDYKLVRILIFKDKRSANIRYLGRALVLNVGKKSWRELENDELPCTHFNHLDVVANGCLHLLVFRPEGGYHHASLLSFDLDEERFRHTSVPYFCNHLNCSLNQCWRMLTVFNKNLAMFISPKFRASEYYNGEPNNDNNEAGGLGNFFELWVCDVVTWSWSKKFSFGRLPRRSFPLGFWSNGEIVVRKDYSHQSLGTSSSIDAYLYNPCDKKTSVITCHEREECSLVFHSYVESLVRL